MIDREALARAMKMPAPELPDDLRVPLHSLQADLDYLLARYASEDEEVRAMLKDSIRNRLSQVEEASYRLTALASQEGAQAGEVVKQWRWRNDKGRSRWTGWYDTEIDEGYYASGDVEERTVYTTPPAPDEAAEARATKAEAERDNALRLAGENADAWQEQLLAWAKAEAGIAEAVENSDGAYRKWLERNGYAHTRQREVAFEYGFRAARAFVEKHKESGT